MKKTSTMRSLLFSALSLLVCASLLIGTTFAWFTDSVVSKNNIIQSGNLDVELEYYDAATQTFKPVTSTVALFDDNALWEPGYTEVAYLKISNLGSLALKYTLDVNVYSETAGTNVANESFKLSDHLVFKVLPIEEAAAGTYTRETAMAAAGKEKGLKTYNGATTNLLKGESDCVALVIYMPTDVDNVANYLKDTTPPSITMGVNLSATQYTYEEDSYGPDYDEDAVFADKTIVLDATADFAATLADIETATDKTVLIELDKDIEWETGSGHGSTPFIGENAVVETLIIDGNGHTLTATGAGVGPIRMANGGTLVFKNMTIVDESVSYDEGAWEFTYLEFDGNLVFENVTFEGGIQLEDANATFTNCTFISEESSVYSVWVCAKDATFTGCTFKGTRGLKIHEDYGSDVGTIVVNNCTFDNIEKKPGVALGDLNADTTVIIKNSDFINCQPGDQNMYIYETDTDVTTFNFDASENNEIIKSVTPDLEIATADELFAFAESVNADGNSYAGKLVVLTSDIDLENREWTPIGQTGGNGVATYFAGMFDGKGHTISNLQITDNAYDEGANYAAGLFGFIDAADAQIVNLNIDKANVNGHHWTGVIVGFLSGKITGCTVTGATVSCTHANDDACGDKAGVITGYVNSGVVTGNTVKDSTVTAGRDAGQVVGAAKTTQAYGNTIYNVTVSATGDCTGANINNAEIGRVMG